MFVYFNKIRENLYFYQILKHFAQREGPVVEPGTLFAKFVYLIVQFFMTTINYTNVFTSENVNDNYCE